ncbi:MAG: hypothetical protein H7178_01185 [Chitinophagaceae bacterium]|nr:hypothetical protein [Chitinophagaceae bacterium]
MLENLFDLVKQNADAAIINNAAIPNERNDEAVETASSSIFDGLRNAVASGNLNDVIGMFSGHSDTASNPVTQNIQGGFIQQLMHKFGLDHNAADGIAGGLIPNVLKKLIHKTNDPNDNSFDLSSILGKLGVGNLDLKNILGKFTGNGNTQGGGGILDSLKGMLGK